MRIATLQLSPSLSEVSGNMRRADELVADLERKISTSRADTAVSAPLDLLVLPEMVFTGYNFPSLDAVRPYLEPTERGVTAQWAQKTARRLGCVVCAGYPEIADSDNRPSTESTTEASGEGRYNSLYICASDGSTLLNYQKRFLYYTDERWAHEGSNGEGFFEMPLARSGTSASLPPSIPTSVGICMDINPYKFIAPWTAYEFARQVQRTRSRLVVLSMAWLTSLPEELVDTPAVKRDPEMATFQYWVERFYPLLDETDGSAGEGTTYFVFANRAGAEPGTEEVDSAVYAGTSCVMAVRRKPSENQAQGGDEKVATTEVLLWKAMGRAVEGICYVDTEDEPAAVFRLRRPADSD